MPCAARRFRCEVQATNPETICRSAGLSLANNKVDGVSSTVVCVSRLISGRWTTSWLRPMSLPSISCRLSFSTLAMSSTSLAACMHHDTVGLRLNRNKIFGDGFTTFRQSSTRHSINLRHGLPAQAFQRSVHGLLLRHACGRRWQTRIGNACSAPSAPSFPLADTQRNARCGKLLSALS